jgi:hypothetical protein
MAITPKIALSIISLFLSSFSRTKKPSEPPLYLLLKTWKIEF